MNCTSSAPSINLTADERHLLLTRLREDRRIELRQHRATGEASGKRWALYAASRLQLYVMAANIGGMGALGPATLLDLPRTIHGPHVPDADGERLLDEMLSNTDSAYRVHWLHDVDEVNEFVQGFASSGVACFRAVQSEIGEMP